MSEILIITGSSRGIGAATAIAAGRLGKKVCINYRTNATAATEVANEIREAGGEACCVQADVGSEEDVVRLFDTVDKQLGRVTSLVNNAGIIGGLQCRVEQITQVRLRNLFDVNVSGAFMCCREAIRRMSTKKGGSGGSIVNVSSIAARLGAPNEYVDYAASKGALDTLTIGLAKEVADEGIRVNSVRPGTIRTEIHATGGVPDRPDQVANTIPLRRPGAAAEVAQSILWLLSDQASYVTGTILDVSGGK